MASTFNLRKQIDVRSKCSNIDSLYGPYESLNDALEALKGREALGRTVGIIESGAIVEYWFKSGTTEEDLIRKIESPNLILSLYGNNELTVEENNPIYVSFTITGKNNINKASLFEVTNGIEVLKQELSSIGKNAVNTIQISNPSVAGIYTYRIKILDASGNYATTESGEYDYIEYTIRYGGISTIYNFVQLNSIKIKNYNSVAGSWFQLNISTRDNSFNIKHVYLSDINDVNSHNDNIELTPFIDKGITQSTTYLGNYYYYLPDSTILRNFNGQQCSIIVEYEENGISGQKIEDIFKLLDISTLNFISESEYTNYYISVPAYYSFQLQSGIENLSVLLTEGSDSDFIIEQTTIYTYRSYSLRIIPKTTPKNGAKLSITCSFRYNNNEYVHTFTENIGDILETSQQDFYEPQQGGTIDLETIIDANVDDYNNIDGDKYYKIMSTPNISTYKSSSFIIDMYVKINQQNNHNEKFLSINYGGPEIVYITEDEISCAGLDLSMTTDTPLNEWVQIGIGINLEEEITRNNEKISAKYHAIYINGMIVKNVIVDNDNTNKFNAQYDLTISLSNNLFVQKCLVYYKNNGENSINPNLSSNQNISIIYNNYKSHNTSFNEPSELPILRFRRINEHDKLRKYYKLINDYKNVNGGDPVKYITKFGNIGLDKALDMGSYDSNYSSDASYDDLYESDKIEAINDGQATLFRQSVEIKKPAQKEYCVLCEAEYFVNGVNILAGVIVEVHTQGTSTLVYSIPNFKFTFWVLVNENKIEPYCPHFILKHNADEISDENDKYYQESVYTAKADFMDSSHLNNTPTCIYYNNLIQNLIASTKIEGSPSAKNGMLDAIMGFPIIMEISDTAEDFSSQFTNIGSFMLNIDKTGNSLGFEIDSDGEEYNCISFEGTSNDNEHGAAGRFDIPENVTLKNYLNNDRTINEEEIRSDYNYAKTYGVKQFLNKFVDGVAVENFPYVKWCKFLSDGLEYRYPDSDIYKTSGSGNSETLKKIMNIDDFIRLYKMWIWVYNSDQLNNVTYKEEFKQYFDLDYCIIYFIQLMIYAQTDNLGKNAMFDSWKDLWYPRPYDLDSEAGLDNNGNDNIATFVEIRPEFSLDYNINYTEEQLIANNLTETSTIQYGTQTYDRYHFSSNTSKLWITFYKNFKEEIESFYKSLRINSNYNPESIIELCKTILIDKLGVNQYNKDFVNKYLANSDQRLAYGNRWYKFKKWITKRFAFCDSYFNAAQNAIYSTTSQFTYSIKMDSPQYVSQQYQGNRIIRFVTDQTSFSAGSGAATKISLFVNQGSVFETGLFKYVTLDSGAKQYTNLLSLDVSGNKNNGFNNINSLVGNELNNLKYLNISNSNVQTLVVPTTVKTLIAENISLNSLVIPQNAQIEEISLKNSTVNSGIEFNTLNTLHKLDLTNCTFKMDVTFAELPNLDELIFNNTIFEKSIIIQQNVKTTEFNFSNLSLGSISFSGTDLQIDTINFTNTTFTNDTININAIKKNIKNLYFGGCKGLKYLEITNEGNFENLIRLNIINSSIIALGDHNDVFDCSRFINIANLKSTEDTENTQFTFRKTNIEHITNINWEGTGNNLFYDCQKLIDISGNIKFIGENSNVNSTFYRCYALESLPTITIDESITSARSTFAGCKKLSWGIIFNFIKKCTNVTQFNNICRCTIFDQNLTIDLDSLFVNNNVVASTISMFSSYSGGDLSNPNNHLKITGKLPSTVQNSSNMFWYVSSIEVPYSILSNANALTNVSCMFGNSTITFTGDNLPTQNNQFNEKVTLTNCIDYSFLPKSIVNCQQMFYNSNVITNDILLFRYLTELTNCNCMFHADSPKKYTFKYNHTDIDTGETNEYTEDISLNVSNMWSNNPNISNISGCFSNVYNVFCSGLNFHEDIDNTKTINISGLFGLDSAGTNNVYRNYRKITFNIDSIIPKLIISNAYPVPTNSEYVGQGTFQNRSMIITSNDTDILYKVQGNCNGAFRYSVIYLTPSIESFNLNSVTSCNYMFQGTRLYKYNTDQSYEYTITDRKFVNISEMPSSCSSYYAMFRDSSVLKSLPSIKYGASDLRYMFAGCIINQDNLQLPANYFGNCRETLTQTERMFENNKYLTSLEYNSEYGLFGDCINLSNVVYMFNGANFLHGGIPINIFGTTELPQLKSLAYMFSNTTSLYDVENYSNKWINESTLLPLANLDNIEGMFYNNRINIKGSYETTYKSINQTVKDNYNNDTQIINASTFTNSIINNISKLFMATSINIPFKFEGFILGTDAFYDSRITNIDSEFVTEKNIVLISNVDRMFYRPTYTMGNTTITNLGNFVTSIDKLANISKMNIAGNLKNTDISDVYKATTTADNYYLGFSLTNSDDQEKIWSNYWRHIYI